MRCKILTPIKVGKKIHKAGSINLPADVAERMIARGYVEPSAQPGDEEEDEGGEGTPPESADATAPDATPAKAAPEAAMTKGGAGQQRKASTAGGKGKGK